VVAAVLPAATTVVPSVRALAVVAMQVRSGRVLRRKEPRWQMVVSTTGGPAGDEAATTTLASMTTVFMAVMKHAPAVALL
jgi:hypothetical protein